ncbi:MAG: energy transducer TonB [Bacteroidales bacterium]|nr:energy transducer TonB [Bacteroidales bacterium]
MEPKKKSNVNLERKRIFFFQLGLMFVLVIVFAAFEWKYQPKENDFMGNTNTTIIFEDIVPTTKQNEIKKPKINVPTPQLDIMKIIDNSMKIQNEFKMGDTEANDSTIILISPIEPEDTTIYDSWEIEKMPQFIGGNPALYQWLREHIPYPKELKEMGIQGKVGVQFVVEKDGSIAEVSIIRGIDPNLDRIIVDSILKMPKWEPGFKNGKYVATKFALPISFKLE